MAPEKPECNNTEKLATEVFEQDKSLSQFDIGQKNLIRLEYLKLVQQVEVSKQCNLTQAELKELLINTVLKNKGKFAIRQRQKNVEKQNNEDHSKILSEIQYDNEQIQAACKLWTNCITDSSEWSNAIGIHTLGFNSSEMTLFNDEVGPSAENAIISIEERADYLATQARRISYEPTREEYNIDDYDGGSKFIGNSKGEALSHIQKEIKILSQINIHREKIGDPYYLFTALQFILAAYLVWKVVKTVILNPVGGAYRRIRGKADLASLKESKKVKAGSLLGNLGAALRFVGKFPLFWPLNWAAYPIQAPLSMLGGQFSTDVVATVDLDKDKLKEFLDIDDVKLLRERNNKDEKELRYTFIDYLRKRGFNSEADNLKLTGNLPNFWGRAYEVLRKVNSSNSKPAPGRVRRALRQGLEFTGNKAIRQPFQELSPLHNPRSICLDVVLKAVELSIKAHSSMYIIRGEVIDRDKPTDFMKKIQDVILNQGKKNKAEFDKYLDRLKNMEIFPTSQDEIKSELIGIVTKGTNYRGMNEVEFDKWFENEKSKATTEHIDFGNEDDPKLEKAKDKINLYKLYTSKNKAKVVELLLKRLTEQRMKLTMKQLAIIINNIDNDAFDEDTIKTAQETRLVQGREYNFNNLEKFDIPSSLGVRRGNEVVACKDFKLGDYLDKLEQKTENIKMLDGQLTQARLTQASSQNPSGLDTHITELEGNIKKEKDAFIKIVHDMEVDLGKIDSLVEGKNYEEIKTNLPKNLRRMVLKRAKNEDIIKAGDKLAERYEGEENRNKILEAKLISNRVNGYCEELKRTIEGLKSDLGAEVLPQDSEINILESLGANVSQTRTLLSTAKEKLKNANISIEETSQLVSTLEAHNMGLLSATNRVTNTNHAGLLLIDANTLEGMALDLKSKTDLVKISVESAKKAGNEAKAEFKKAEEKVIADFKTEIDKKVLELSDTNIGELKGLIVVKLQERDKISLLIDDLRKKIEEIERAGLRLEVSDKELLSQSHGLLASLESELVSLNRLLSEAGRDLFESNHKIQNVKSSIGGVKNLKEAKDVLDSANYASDKFSSASRNLATISQKLNDLKKYEGPIRGLIGKLEVLKTPKIEEKVPKGEVIDAEFEEIYPGKDELEKAKLYVSSDKFPKVEALEKRISKDMVDGKKFTLIQIKNALSNIILFDNLDISEIPNGNIFELKEGIRVFDFAKLEKVTLISSDGNIDLVVGEGNKKVLEAWGKFRNDYEQLDIDIKKLKDEFHSSQDEGKGREYSDKLKEKSELIKRFAEIVDGFPEEVKFEIGKEWKKKGDSDSKGFFDAVVKIFKKAEFKHK